LETGFSLYLSHILLRKRTDQDMARRIVALKGAGSSPVGHPPAFRISELKTLDQRCAQQQEYALLTPL